VVTVVKEGGRPALLTDGFVTSLRRAVECSSVEVERIAECTEYSVGDEVIVQDGILAGVAGVVRQTRGSRQLVIWVPAIGGGVALTIGTAAVLRRPNAATGSDCVPNL
jgi:transcription antitermination factor NusG